MIYLEQETANTVIMELTLNGSLTSPYYLFEFTNDTTREQTYFNATDISNSPQRYNCFRITLTGGTQSLTGGTLNLRSGSYTVNVYESATPTLSVADTTGTPISTATALKAIVDGLDQQYDDIYR